jgi:hypothetical protein
MREARQVSGDAALLDVHAHVPLGKPGHERVEQERHEQVGLHLRPREAAEGVGAAQEDGLPQVEHGHDVEDRADHVEREAGPVDKRDLERCPRD